MPLRGKIGSGEFAIIAEIYPPKGTDFAKTLDAAGKATMVVDSFCLTDMTGGIMRMSPIGLIPHMRERNLDVIIESSAVHRNRVALQGDLLAAAASGASGILVIEGEAPAEGDHHDAEVVSDLDDLELLKALHALVGGTDLSGAPLEGTFELSIGASISFGTSMETAEEKVKCGAEYLVTPPMFTAEDAKLTYTKYADLGVPLISSIYLLKSVGMARYINHHQPGVSIPEALFDRMQDSEAVGEECIRIAADQIKSAAEIGFSGALIATFGCEHRLSDIVQLAGIGEQK